MNEIITRREMVEQALRAAALPGATFFFSAFLANAEHQNHASAPPQPNPLDSYKPQFFSNEEFVALEAFTDILIPADDTPGARDAYCPQYIDFVLYASTEAAPQTQTNWRTAMAAVRETGFFTASASRRLELVTEMSRPERETDTRHSAFAAYRLIKQQTAFAFYTSRKGMIESLDYRGNSYNPTFPACNHPDHQRV